MIADVRWLDPLLWSLIDGGTAVKFGWYLDNWQVAHYADCTCDDPNPNGVDETVIKQQLLTTYWIHYCN